MRSSDGREFAIAFSASQSDWLMGFCGMYITSSQTTSVTVETAFYNNTYTINSTSPNIAKVEFEPSAFRTLTGRENKGIIVRSDSADISIKLMNSRDSSTTETLLALPRNDSQLEYYVFSYPYETENQCAIGTTTVFYSVIAYDDDTTLAVYSPSPSGQYEIRFITFIDRFEVFTERSIKEDIIEITGMKIVTNKAVTVTAGNACSALVTTDTSPYTASPMWANMPAIQEVGSTFVSVPVITNVAGSHTYTLRVLAVSNDTEVTFRESSDSARLQAGQFYNKVIDKAYEDEVIQCSKPCLVAQYGMGDDSAIFLVVLPSTDKYVTSSKFTIPGITSANINNLDNFISIVLLTSNPLTAGMTLDGIDISGESGWVSVGNEYSYLAYEMSSITNQVHRLECSTPFICMVNGHMGNNAGSNGDGYAYISDSSGK